MKKKQVNENIIEFNVDNDKKYRIEIIWNSVVYAKKLEIDYILRFYYYIF